MAASEPQRIPIYRLVEIASCFTRLPISDIRGNSRLPRLVRPRFAVSYVAYKAGWTTLKIGRAIGRDHSSVCHALRRAEDCIAREPDFAALIAVLEECADAWAAGQPEPEAKWLREPVVTMVDVRPKPRKPRRQLAVIDIKAQRRIKNELCPDDDDAGMRLRGSLKLIAAIRREHPERCAA